MKGKKSYIYDFNGRERGYTIGNEVIEETNIGRAIRLNQEYKDIKANGYDMNIDEIDAKRIIADIKFYDRNLTSDELFEIMNRNFKPSIVMVDSLQQMKVEEEKNGFEQMSIILGKIRDIVKDNKDIKLKTYIDVEEQINKAYETISLLEDTYEEKGN